MSKYCFASGSNFQLGVPCDPVKQLRAVFQLPLVSSELLLSGMEITLNSQSCGPSPALSPPAEPGVERRPAMATTASVVYASRFIDAPPKLGIFRPLVDRMERSPTPQSLEPLIAS